MIDTHVNIMHKMIKLSNQQMANGRQKKPEIDTSDVNTAYGDARNVIINVQSADSTLDAFPNQLLNSRMI